MAAMPLGLSLEETNLVVSVCIVRTWKVEKIGRCSGLCTARSAPRMHLAGLAASRLTLSACLVQVDW